MIIKDKSSMLKITGVSVLRESAEKYVFLENVYTYIYLLTRFIRLLNSNNMTPDGLII